MSKPPAIGYLQTECPLCGYLPCTCEYDAAVTIFPPLEVRIADYPQVKAVIDAARKVCETTDVFLWESETPIGDLRTALEALTVE